jgi:hypothetical protein
MTITAIRPKIFATETPELNSLFEQRKTITSQLAALDKSIIDLAQ